MKTIKKRYSRLTVGQLVGYASNGDALYKCTCDCGNRGPLPLRWLEGKFIEECEQCEDERIVEVINLGGNGVRPKKLVLTYSEE